MTKENLAVVEKEQPQQQALSVANEQRAIAEVQAAVTIAKRFPRDESAAREKILIACARPSLAERAIFTYARGGNDITGVTIRLAEEVARQWKNIDYGWRTIEQRIDESTVEAFAWDLESNARTTRQFQVSHRRHTKQGSYLLSDPRDIYEKQANEAARRVRACVLALIPGDIIDDARDQCEQTMNTSEEITPNKLKKMVAQFEKYGVTLAQIEKRIQRKIDAIQPAQMVQLRKIFNSLQDGMSDKTAWFESDAPAAETSNGKGVSGLKEKLGKKDKPLSPSNQAIEQGDLALDEPPPGMQLPHD